MNLVKSSLRFLLQNYWQSGLAILGIVLSISVITSIDIAISSSKKAFEIANERTLGKTTHQIRSHNNEFVDQSLIREIKVNQSYKDASPVIETYLSLTNKNGEALRTVHLMGLSFINEKKFRSFQVDNQAGLDNKSLFDTKNKSAFLSKKTAQELGLSLGDKFYIQHHTKIIELSLAAYINSSSAMLDNLLICDIIQAQKILGMEGKISHIDLIDNGKIDQLKIPERYQLVDAGKNNNKSMTESFNLNLTALSYLSLLVAIFLIYNSISFSVTQRRRLIAVLRTIGASKKQIISMVLLESVVFAVIGISLGLVFGLLLAKVLLQLITQTINDLYFVLEIQKLSINAASFIKAIALGLVSSLIAALIPAFDAANSSPLLAMSKVSFEQKRDIPNKVLVLISVICLSLGYFLINFQCESKNLLLTSSFAALVIFILAAVALIPILIKIFCALLDIINKKFFGFNAKIALRSISSQLNRTSIAIITLSLAISVSIALATSIASFRHTVASWLETSLQADIYISAARLVATKNETELEPKLIREIRKICGKDLKELLSYRNRNIKSNLGIVNLAAINTSEAVERIMKFKSQEKNAWQKFSQSAEHVIISEPFAYKHKLKTGDKISLYSKDGLCEFSIAGVFYDYGNEQGIVMIASQFYQNYWQDLAVSSLGLLVKDSKQAPELIEKLNKELSDEYKLIIRSNKKLKQESMEIFDRTFKVTDALKIISLLIAFIAITSTFLSMLLERKREYAGLIASGVSSREILRILISQTLIMAIFAAIIAIPLGLLQAKLLIELINYRSFGWTLDFIFAANSIVEAFSYAIIAALLALIYPAYKVKTIKVAEELRNE